MFDLVQAAGRIAQEQAGPRAKKITVTSEHLRAAAAADPARYVALALDPAPAVPAPPQ